MDIGAHTQVLEIIGHQLYPIIFVAIMVTINSRLSVKY